MQSSREREDDNSLQEWSMFGSFVELYIFTTILTRWSFKEVKDTFVLLLHYIFG